MVKLVPLSRLDRVGCKDLRALGDLAVPREPDRLRGLRLGPVVVLRVDRDDTLGSVADVEHERDVERDEVAGVVEVEARRGVGEPNVAHRDPAHPATRCGSHVGELEVGGQIAEQVEGECGRPQQIRPQALPIERLVWFLRGESRRTASSALGVRKLGARLLCVVEGKPAADET